MREPVTPTDTVFQVLAHEHRDLEARFAQLYAHAAASVESARLAYAQLAAAVIAHLHAESAVLLPRLAKIAALEQLLDDTRGNHARIESEVRALERANLTDSEWLRALRRLEDHVVQLIDHEEGQVYPAARRAVPLDEAHHLAKALRTIEDRELAGG